MAQLQQRGHQKQRHRKTNFAFIQKTHIPTVATFHADPRGLAKTIESMGLVIGDNLKLLAMEIVYERVKQDVANLRRGFGAMAGNLYRGTNYNRGHPLKLIGDNIDIQLEETGDNFTIHVFQDPVYGSRDPTGEAEFGELYDQGKEPFSVKINLNFPGSTNVWSSTAFYRQTSKNRAMIPGEFMHPGFPALGWKEMLNKKIESRLEEHAQNKLNEIVGIEQEPGGKLHIGDVVAGEDVYVNRRGQTKYRGETAKRNAEQKGLTRENVTAFGMLSRDVRALRQIGRTYRR